MTWSEQPTDIFQEAMNLRDKHNITLDEALKILEIRALNCIIENMG